MKQALLLIAAMAMFTLPAAADAAQCRDSATGKFAKCGSPGAVPASQYVARTRAPAKTPVKAGAAPAPAATKPGMLAILKAKAKPAPAAPAAKPLRCKTAAGKFVKCGTPGAKPA